MKENKEGKEEQLDDKNRQKQANPFTRKNRDTNAYRDGQKKPGENKPQKMFVKRDPEEARASMKR